MEERERYEQELARLQSVSIINLGADDIKGLMSAPRELLRRSILTISNCMCLSL